MAFEYHTVRVSGTIGWWTPSQSPKPEDLDLVRNQMARHGWEYVGEKVLDDGFHYQLTFRRPAGSSSQPPPFAAQVTAASTPPANCLIMFGLMCITVFGIMYVLRNSVMRC